MNIENNGAENVEEVKVETTQEETTQEETQEERQQETPEAKYARLKRQTEQLAKKLGIEAEKPSKSSKKANEFDYSEKAYLAANGIKGQAEFNLAKDWIANTGKTLDDLIENKYFQQELKDFRETLNTANATPTTSKRSTSSTRDTVDYWLAKPFGELPESFELRKKVVEARRKQDKSVSPFG